MAKIIFFDLDGTLRPYNDSGIRPSTERAIARARRAGVRCFVATGRHPLEIAEEGLLGNMQFDGYIYLNGCYCVDEMGKILYDAPVPPSQIQAMLDAQAEEDFALMLMEADRMYINRCTPQVEKMQASVQTRVPPVVKDLRSSLKKTIYQMVLYADNATLSRLEQRLPLCTAVQWTDAGGALDVMPLEGGKCRAIRKVLEYYGIDPADAAAVGDGYNDIEMLRAMGMGVAMGNAFAPVKAAADCIAPDIEDDGLEWAVEHILNAPQKK